VQLDVVSLEGQERQVTIERRTLPRPPLKHFNVSGPGGQLLSYIRLHYFSSDGTRMVRTAIKEGETLGVDGYSEWASLG
jgi:C-terminal processing protease CtpA/Prc